MPSLDSSINTWKAIIAYDGTNFYGFQRQKKGRTVQGVLEDRLSTIAQQPIGITASGRTDTGVHASGQVVAFHLSWNHPPANLQKALNATLPPDIVIKSLTEASPDFHPRFDARSRQYQYTILNQSVRDVFNCRFSTLITKPLDVSQMQVAGNYLLGTHNFASFGRAPQGDNTVRTVTQTEWAVNAPEIIFTITANAFLFRMVRSIVGTLIKVGLGELAAEAIPDILKAKNRAKAPAPALPCGLCLVNVIY